MKSSNNITQKLQACHLLLNRLEKGLETDIFLSSLCLQSPWSFILNSSLPFRLKPPSLPIYREAYGLLLDISSTVIFLPESKGGLAKVRLLLNISKIQFPVDSAEEKLRLVSEEKQVFLRHHSSHHKVFQVGQIHHTLSMVLCAHCV